MKIKKTKAAAEEISIDAAVAATGRRFRIERGEGKTALEAFLSGQVSSLILTVSGRKYI